MFPPPVRFWRSARGCGALLLLTPVRREIGDDQQRQHHHKDQGGQGIHGWLDAPPHFAVDQGGQGVDPGPFGKMGDDKII